MARCDIQLRRINAVAIGIEADEPLKHIGAVCAAR
jgi:hypothetical protein